MRAVAASRGAARERGGVLRSAEEGAGASPPPAAPPQWLVAGRAGVAAGLHSPRLLSPPPGGQGAGHRLPHGSLGGPGRAGMPRAGACARLRPLRACSRWSRRPAGGVCGWREARRWEGGMVPGRAPLGRVGRRSRRRDEGAAAPLVQLGLGRPAPLLPSEAFPGRRRPPPRVQQSLRRWAGGLGWGDRGGLCPAHRRGPCTRAKCSGPAWLHLEC